MDFCLFLNIWEKILVKITSKNLSSKYRQKLIDHAKQSATDAFITASKRAIQKQQKQLLTELPKSQKLHNRIIHN